jgi:hypothetical protein
MARHRWLATLLLVPLLQCQESVTAPDLPDDIRSIAIRLRVDVGARTVTPIGLPATSNVSFSLVGNDGVTVQTSNMNQSPLGMKKTLVRFDVAITNSLSNVTLIKPTVPAPPSGTTGLVLFPFQATPVTGSGDIAASSDWDGAPHNFFNDASCKNAAGSDCLRWEEYAAPLAAGATSAARTVGFEVDKSITTFDVVMLLAADLQNVPPAPAAIALSQTTASMTYASGVFSPNVLVTVTNSGGGTLSGLTATVTYQAGQPSGWIHATLSGTTAPATLTLATLLPVSSTDGTFNATVAVASAGASNSPQNIAVTLVATGLPSVSAIYVSESDPVAVDDMSCGLQPAYIGGHPCRTINFGLARAVAVNRTEVRVADGHYSEAVTLISGRNLLGGYRPDTWQRHVTSTNTIIDGVSSVGNHDRTIIATGITQPTMFDGFVVRGAVNSKPAGNSYALYVSNSGALTVSHNVIYAGSGGPGLQGAAGTAGGAGANGTGRDSDPSAYDSKIATGAGQCDASNNRSYANGGIGVSGGDIISGGDGGGNTCPPSSLFARQSAQNGDPGNAGAGAGGGAAGTPGAGGVDFQYELHVTLGSQCYVAPAGSHVGGNGGQGGNGQPGGAALGAAIADGSVIATHWVGASGANGTAGANGGGGGGGGAGGGAFSLSPASSKDRLGGVGGGGGAGGAGGGGGGAGSGGGGAFGIFIFGAAPVVSDNSIVRGSGGVGGGGGTGAVGALGGQGGAGGLAPVFCTEVGGRGGNGGQGGTGSGGGGGSGGASFGIFTSGAGTPNYCTTANNSISGGAGGNGGQGGASQGNPGGAGVTGALTPCTFK